VQRLLAGLRALAPYALVTIAGFGLAYSVLYVLLPSGAAAASPRVPDLVGLSLDSARTRLEQLGYAVRANPPIPHPTIAEGVVIAQSPSPGTEDPSGSAVTLTISAGNRRTTVPGLIGLPREDAESLLTQAGLAAGEIEERPSALARGTILDTRPVPGAVIGVPGSVTLIVSGGPAEVIVPDVLGQDFAAARTQLEQLGLTADSAGAEPSSSVPPGSVISQAPDAGTKIPSGAKVRLIVATP
jgi:serine/threonine-protein kinase